MVTGILVPQQVGHNVLLIWDAVILHYFSIQTYFTLPGASKTLQSCRTLCDPIDGSPPGSILGILQARTLEWVAISFSNAWNWKVKVKSLSCVRLLVTPCTAAYQAPLSTGLIAKSQTHKRKTDIPHKSHCLYSLGKVSPFSHLAKVSYHCKELFYS